MTDMQKAPDGNKYTWMPAPEGVTSGIPGLDYLAQVDQLILKQQVELFEVLTGCEAKNRFLVFNNVGQQVYFAKEESDCAERYCCGPARGFVIHITDNLGNEVIRVTRDFACCKGCCWCADGDCGFIVQVEAPPGQVVGYVRQQTSKCAPYYTIRSADSQIIGHVNGPACVCNTPCCGDVEFPVTGNDQTTQIGMIAKRWTGALKELFTDADTFYVNFPIDMDVRCKATFIGAVFLIDFMFFEKNSNS